MREKDYAPDGAAPAGRSNSFSLTVFSGTTSDPAEWRRLTALGVDAILTDDPLALMKN